MRELSEHRKRFDPVHPKTAASNRHMMMLRQTAKINEIRDALRSEGLIVLDQQARALGLCRSTTWTILQGAHKSSGLSVLVLRRMLDSPYLPDSVRFKIQEYVAEKSAGLYGHSSTAIRKFRAKLSIAAPEPATLRSLSKSTSV